ncbi:MAG: M23 family metallopeptidase [Chitinophagaceae bacterium]
MKKNYFLFLLLFSGTVKGNAQETISILARPEKILIETGEDKQSLNFDFLVTYSYTDTARVTKLELSVYDRNNKLELSRFLDENGTAPGILVIPNRTFNGPSSQLMFNPFAEFASTITLSKLVYQWTFTKNNGEEIKQGIEVFPKSYLQQQQFLFPLKGKVLIYDGHDLYSHHRRFDYEFKPIKALGISANFMRYAYDFVLLDKEDKHFEGDGTKDEQYTGYGKPVYSIGAGKVIYLSNDHKDDKTFNIPGIATNPLELYGNCIAIQHGDGVVSIYGHLKQNSIKVKLGDPVKALQEIAQIGVSGSSFFPHLHFEMRTSIQHTAEGLPSYFANVYQEVSSGLKKLRLGLVETGNIIIAR